MVPWQQCHGNGAMATGERRGDVGGYSWWQRDQGAPLGLGCCSPGLAPRQHWQAKAVASLGLPLGGSGAPDPSWVPGRAGR